MILLGNAPLNDRRPTPPVWSCAGSRLLLNDRMQVGLGLGLRDAWLESSKQMDVANSVDYFASLEDYRKVDISAPPHESLWHDTNDGPYLVIEPQFSSDDAGVARKLSLPEFVAENNHRHRFWGCHPPV